MKATTIFLTVLAAASLAACSAPSEAPEPAEEATNVQSPDAERIAELEQEIAVRDEQLEIARGYINDLSTSLRQARGLIVNTARVCVTPDDAVPLVVEEAEGGGQDADANLAAASAYMDAVRAETCVFTLPSGLSFRIRQSATDGGSPAPGDLVTVHYRGSFIHGGDFDSSYSRNAPMTFPSDRLIRGWIEALPLMRVGEAWELFIHPDLGYGARGTPGGPIGPNQALVFQLELLDLPAPESAEE